MNTELITCVAVFAFCAFWLGVMVGALIERWLEGDTLCKSKKMSKITPPAMEGRKECSKESGIKFAKNVLKSGLRKCDSVLQ